MLRVADDGDGQVAAAVPHHAHHAAPASRRRVPAAPLVAAVHVDRAEAVPRHEQLQDGALQRGGVGLAVAEVEVRHALVVVGDPQHAAAVGAAGRQAGQLRVTETHSHLATAGGTNWAQRAVTRDT